MKPKARTLFIALSTVVLVSAGLFFANSRFNGLPHIVTELTASSKRTPFPEIDLDQLSPKQQRLIAILKQEYASQPAGSKYSEGVKEPWCADFVSWVFREAGEPLVNPNSQSWRIPGTYTLRDYYQSAGRFRAANSGYTPKVGDIMLYDNPSPFGQHTNIVINNDKGTITTIGGNEPGGIRVFVHSTPDKAGFVGYGVLPNESN